MSEKKATETGVLVFAAAFPTAAAWVYFVQFSGESWMLPLGALSKVVQFGLPAVWVWLVLRQRPKIRGVSREGLLFGALSGLGSLAACLGLYYGYLKHHPAFKDAPAALGEKLAGLGGDSLGGFLLIAVFYSVIHSFLEEYYWRWFVYGRARSYLGPTLANLFSSLAFMAHHVVVINAFLPDDYFWSATVPLSLCVAFGGAIWAALYERKGSLYGAWLSHALVDVSVMICGYDMADLGGS
ncbi:MAG: CPBP family intramembrane metalloprotease [Planctomycetes bacterium]|nr:CPBP family intramembrane metalloprotease [Planctomycetota bacterium]